MSTWSAETVSSWWLASTWAASLSCAASGCAGSRAAAPVAGFLQPAVCSIPSAHTVQLRVDRQRVAALGPAGLAQVIG